MLLFITPIFANAQDVVVDLNADTPLQISNDFSLSFPENNREYLVSQWSKGKLFYTNGTSKTYDSLNFNRHLNILEVVTNNKVLFLQPMGLAGALIYDSANKGTVLLVGKTNGVSRFLVIMSQHKYLLASYIEVEKPPVINEAKVDEIRFVAKEEPVSIISSRHTVLINDTWEDIKWNKSGISKLFKIDKKELQKRASNAGIALDNERGLFNIFDLLNHQ